MDICRQNGAIGAWNNSQRQMDGGEEYIRVGQTEQIKVSETCCRKRSRKVDCRNNKMEVREKDSQKEMGRRTFEGLGSWLRVAEYGENLRLINRKEKAEEKEGSAVLKGAIRNRYSPDP